jgi:hypothetical protein
MAFFVGGQIFLVAAVVPSLRAAEDRERVRKIARRFGWGTLAAIAVVIGTGVPLASHFHQWESGSLHVKLALVAIVAGLVVWLMRRPQLRAAEGAIFVASLAIVWLGCLARALAECHACFQRDRLLLLAEAVAQTPGHAAGSLLRVSSEIGHLVRPERAGGRQVVPDGGSGVHFRERAAGWRRRLCATASRLRCSQISPDQLNMEPRMAPRHRNICPAAGRATRLY